MPSNKAHVYNQYETPIDSVAMLITNDSAFIIGYPFEYLQDTFGRQVHFLFLRAVDWFLPYGTQFKAFATYFRLNATATACHLHHTEIIDKD
jgi:hypothetical protein